MSNSKSVLEVKNIYKSFKDYSSGFKRIFSWFGFDFRPTANYQILKDINFIVRKGESIGILGKNGAGKSTLLKLITGTIRQDSGSIIINGKIGAILELGMGFNPNLTGRQNAYNTLSLMGYTTSQVDSVITEIESFADIGKYFDQPVRIYSSGMKTRVSFAVATAFRPDILIIDEALSVGDVLFQSKCYERIAKYKKLGTVLFLVTHSIDQVLKHCTRGLFIKDGRIELDAAPKDVTNRYLDELFGKTKIESSPLVISKKMITQEDLYNTRVGYNKNEYRWGHGGAKILDYIVYANGKKFPRTIEGNMKTEFHFKVLFENSYNNVTIGFLIKTLDGIFLYGTNSFLTSSGKENISIDANTIHFFKFTMPMNLNKGSYLVSIGVSIGPQEKLIPLERRYDSILININRNRPFSGIVDLKANFTMETINE